MWPNPQETADLVSFTEEILNWKLHFLCSAVSTGRGIKSIFFLTNLQWLEHVMNVSKKLSQHFWGIIKRKREKIIEIIEIWNSYYRLISCHWPFSMPPENTRKPMFSGEYRERPMARNELMQNKFSLAETLDLIYFDWSYHPVAKHRFEVNNKSLVATSIYVVLVFLLQLWTSICSLGCPYHLTGYLFLSCCYEYVEVATFYGASWFI